MDPYILYLAIGSLICGIGVGINWSKRMVEVVIDETIEYLIKNNYVHGRKDKHGDWEILTIDEN